MGPRSISRIAFAVTSLGVGSCSRLGSSSLPAWAPPLLTPSGGATGTVDSLKVQVPALLDHARIPGLAVAVITEGTVTWTGGFGVADATTRQPVTPSTIFEAASLGKPVLATIALRLVEEGRLSLDRPIAHDYDDPDFAKEPLYSYITLRHLLSHSAGLSNLRRGQPPKIYFQPGDHFSYSGVGVSVAQHLIEHVTGAPLEVAAARLVFQPAGMTNTSYVWQPRFDGRAAVGHDGEGKPMARNKPSTAFAPASLQSTAEDYGRFLSALLQGRLLGESTLRQMLTHQLAVTPSCVECLGAVGPERSASVFWGLGWGLDRTADGLAFWQWGDNNVFRSYAVVVPGRNTGLVYFANSENGLAVRNALVSHVLGGEHPDWDFVKYDQYDSPASLASRSILEAFAKDARVGVTAYQREKALGHVPSDESFLDQLGFTFFTRHQPKTALAIWELEAAEFPTSFQPYDSLGLGYMVTGDRERSLANYRKALALNPLDEHAKKALGGGR